MEYGIFSGCKYSFKNAYESYLQNMGYFLAANILLKTREEILHKTYLSSEIILDEI